MRSATLLWSMLHGLEKHERTLLEPHRTTMHHSVYELDCGSRFISIRSAKKTSMKSEDARNMGRRTDSGRTWDDDL